MARLTNCQRASPKADRQTETSLIKNAYDKTAFAPINNNHLLGIEGMMRPEIEGLLNRANQFAELPSNEVLGHLNKVNIFNLFFENSTRTKVSFDLAGRRIGASVVSVPMSTSSIKKGESLLDTAATLNAMHPDILVMRHPNAGAALMLSRHVDAAVINAGDGRHEHPTQALLDALTIRRRIGDIAGLKIAICGDIANSRVARSNIHLLSILGAEIRLVCPSTLLPAGIDAMGIETFCNLKEGIRDVDIVMLLRLQTERMQGTETPSQREYFHLFGLDESKLAAAAPNALIMHPGPMNRGIEIDSALADDHERSLITMQVEMGVAVRMACLEAIAAKKAKAYDTVSNVNVIHRNQDHDWQVLREYNTVSDMNISHRNQDHDRQVLREYNTVSDMNISHSNQDHDWQVLREYNTVSDMNISHSNQDHDWQWQVDDTVSNVGLIVATHTIPTNYGLSTKYEETPHDTKESETSKVSIKKYAIHDTKEWETLKVSIKKYAIHDTKESETSKVSIKKHAI